MNEDTPPYTGPERRNADNMRAQVYEIANRVDHIADELAWIMRLSKWGITLGVATFGGIIGIVLPIHTAVDANFQKLVTVDNRVNSLEQLQGKHAERSRADHLNCHRWRMP